MVNNNVKRVDGLIFSAGQLRMLMSAKPVTIHGIDDDFEEWRAPWHNGLTKTAERLAAWGFIEPRIFQAKTEAWVRLTPEGIKIYHRANEIAEAELEKRGEEHGASEENAGRRIDGDA